MQNNIHIHAFPKERQSSQNALTFGVYSRNASVFLKKTPKYKKMYRNLCQEYHCQGVLEEELMQDIALLYAEKELVLQAKTAKIKEAMFEMLKDPDLPCYATCGQAPAFKNIAAFQIYNLLTATNDKAEEMLEHNQNLLDETETEYATAFMKKAELEKEMAFLPEPHQDYEIYKRQCHEHYEKYSANYKALQDYIAYLTQDALPPLYNVMIALIYKQDIWSYLEKNAVILSEKSAGHLDKKINAIDKKIEVKIALYFKIKHAKNLENT